MLQLWLTLLGIIIKGWIDDKEEEDGVYSEELEEEDGVYSEELEEEDGVYSEELEEEDGVLVRSWRRRMVY